jgi:hypothetical protein
MKSEWTRKTPLYLEKDDDRYEYHAKQLEELGFSDSETWGLESVIFSFVLPRLKHFRKLAPNFPMGMTMEEWRTVLDKMIVGIELYLKDGWDKNSQEGVDLFFKYFHHLWW